MSRLASYESVPDGTEGVSTGICCGVVAVSILFWIGVAIAVWLFWII